MTISADDHAALSELDARLRTMLPQEYQDSYEDVQPVSMGSAGLKYAPDGHVAWDEMWDTFCDLAMAGGPPHKGTLLEPGTPAAIDAQPNRYREVVDEICRGVVMVTELPVRISPVPGWVRVDCYGDVMSGWLLRAITMENVSVQSDGRGLDLPAAPGFRLEKEIKNVITVIAKTCHYYLGHMPRAQQRAIASLFTALTAESPLIVPGASVDGQRPADAAPAVAAMGHRIERDTGLRPSHHQYATWLGLECPSVGAAVWMMRALVVSNVLSRREGTVLFVPVNPVADPDGARVSRDLARVHHLARVKNLI